MHRRRLRIPLRISVLLLWGLYGIAARGQGVDPALEVRSAGVSQPIDTAPELMLYNDLPMVVAAGKREQSQQQAAASVTVVNAEDIELFGYRSLAEVLRNQRSFYLHTDGLNWFAGVRGFLRPGEWNARIQVLVDGRPTSDPIYGQTHIDQDFVVPMEAIERVEIIRGPGSALYGSNAVFGVINVITKSGADVNGGQVRASAGTKESGRASLLLGKTFADGWDLVGSASGYSSQGNRDVRYDGVHDAAHNFGHIQGYDVEDVGAAFFKAHKNDFTIEFDVARREKDNRSATYMTSWFDPGREQEERANASIRYDHQVDVNQSLHAMAYISHYGYRQNWQYDDDGSGQPYRYFTEAESDWAGAETHYDWQVSRSFHLTVGADAMQSLVIRQHDHDSLSGTVLDVDDGTNSFGAFAEGELKVTSWLSLVAGARVDWVERLDTQFSPRFAAIITPTKDDVVKLLYGRAFRAPNLYEMFYAQPLVNAPNPGLRPEVVDTYEAVWERQWRDGWRSSLNYYFWEMSNAMENVALEDGSLQTQNTDSILAQGIEAEVQKRWQSGARARAYGTLQRAVHDGEKLTHSPTWIVGGEVAIPFFRKNTFLAIEPQIVGPMQADFGDWTKPSFVTDIVLTSRDIFRNWDVQVGVFNLFGDNARLPRDNVFNHYQPWLRYPGAELMVSLTYRF